MSHALRGKRLQGQFRGPGLIHEMGMIVAFVCVERACVERALLGVCLCVCVCARVGKCNWAAVTSAALFVGMGDISRLFGREDVSGVRVPQQVSVATETGPIYRLPVA